MNEKLQKAKYFNFKRTSFKLNFFRFVKGCLCVELMSELSFKFLSGVSQV